MLRLSKFYINAPQSVGIRRRNIMNIISLVLPGIIVILFTFQVSACFVPGGWPVGAQYECAGSMCKYFTYVQTYTSPRLGTENMGGPTTWRLHKDSVNSTWTCESGHSYYISQVNNLGYTYNYEVSAGTCSRENVETIDHTKSGYDWGVDFTLEVANYGIDVVDISYSHTTVVESWKRVMNSTYWYINTAWPVSCPNGKYTRIDWVYSWQSHYHYRQKLKIFHVSEYSILTAQPVTCGDLTDEYYCWDDKGESSVSTEHMWNLQANTSGDDFGIPGGLDATPNYYYP